jgi:small-conductance mechanosensitive channel
MKIIPQKIWLKLGLSGFAILSFGQPNVPGVPARAADPTQVIQFLGKTISWYRQLAVEQKIANQASEFTFAQENRRVADQVVQQAFEYARSQAELQSKRSANQQAPRLEEDAPPDYQGLGQAEQKVEQDIQEIEGEVKSFRERLANAPAAKKSSAQALVEETESELALLQARRDAIRGMIEFVNSSNTGKSSTDLRNQIEELARSVPEALSRVPGTNQRESTAEPASAAVLPANTKPEPSGIWGLATDLINLSGKKHTLDHEIAAIADLQQTSKQLQRPLLDYLSGLVRQGNVLADQADTSGPAQLSEQKRQLDALTTQFKQTAAGLLPLNKASVLLDIYSRTLSNWRQSLSDESRDEWRQLLLRLGGLVVMIAVIFGLGEIWRKATVRYVHDVRRRYQFLLMRRIVLWIAVLVIIVLTFATQLGSIVTFAGLITAGVAVALQNVIVSIVGYFFLIGKYGIRVGDRVQISGVTGEVVDIGLVRLHLMELGGPGESQPSGRVVAFSNSIVFQPTAGLFKQIPGTNFVWHQLKLTLAPETDYRAASERITKAVDAVMATYREHIEIQRQVMEQHLNSMASADLKPKVRLQYTRPGIEVSVRYPAEIEKAGEMDDHLMRELIAAVNKEPILKLVSTEMPVSSAGETAE